RNGSTVRGTPCEARALVKLLAQFAPLAAGPVDGQHAIGDLARLHDIFWPHCRDVDRHIRPWRSEAQFEAAFKIEEFAVIKELLAAQDHPDDLDIFTGALHRFFKGDAVPVFDNIGARWAKAEDNTPARTLIQCSNRAGYQRGGTRVNIGDARADLDALRFTHQVSHRGKEFVAPGFADPDGIKAQFVGY